ncbi:uncharacterized [Tachysurus ichikawai]
MSARILGLCSDENYRVSGKASWALLFSTVWTTNTAVLCLNSSHFIRSLFSVATKWASEACRSLEVFRIAPELIRERKNVKAKILSEEPHVHNTSPKIIQRKTRERGPCTDALAYLQDARMPMRDGGGQGSQICVSTSSPLTETYKESQVALSDAPW